MKKYGYSFWFLTAFFLSIPGTFVIVFLAANILSGYIEPEGQALILVGMLGLWTLAALVVFVMILTFRLTISADTITVGNVMRKRVIPLDRIQGYAENKMDGKDDYSSLTAHTQKWLTIVYLDAAGKEQKERLHLNYFHKPDELKDDVIEALNAKNVFVITPPLPPMSGQTI